MERSERADRAARAHRAVAELAAREVVAVALTCVDNSGITRLKAVPLAQLPHAAEWGVGVPPSYDTYLVDDSSVTGRYTGGPIGDLRLHPDLERLAVLAAAPGWAWAPADRYDQDGAPHPQDARLRCRQEVARLAAAGFTVRAGFEVEWCVSAGSGDEFVPATRAPGYGMTRVVEFADYLRELLEALGAAGVVVAQIHPEYAAGQYEVSVAPADPVTAADTAVLVRETVRQVSLRHGLRATFAPQVVAGEVGNGSHVHLSLWRDGANLMTGGERWYGLTADGEAFAAGVFSRIGALLALGAGSVASYLRLVPSQWASAYACWGRENREAPLRLVPGAAGHQPAEANVEVKCFDATGNPYLAVAGLLRAGRAGLATGERLPEPLEVDPATLPDPERTRRGIVRLPTSLAEAVTALAAEPVLAEVLGEELLDTLVTVRRGEIARFAGATPQEVVAATRWRY